jgi:uncharacterized protein (DUF2384 family)
MKRPLLEILREKSRAVFYVGRCDFRATLIPIKNTPSVSAREMPYNLSDKPDIGTDIMQPSKSSASGDKGTIRVRRTIKKRVSKASGGTRFFVIKNKKSRIAAEIRGKALGRRLVAKKDLVKLTDTERRVLGSLIVRRFIDRKGHVAVDNVADWFGISKAQLAQTVGVRPETLHRVQRATAAKTQGRVKEMLEIVGRVSDWAGGKDQAMAWYRAEPIPAFGGRTAESLVKEGKATAVRDYLDHIAVGGFA